MTPAFDHYSALMDKAKTKNRFAVLQEDAANHYHTEQLPIIPAQTKLVLEFAGDFGLYGIADVSGVLHKIRLETPDLHKVQLLDDWFAPGAAAQDDTI